MGMEQRNDATSRNHSETLYSKNVALFFLNIRLCWLTEAFVLFNNAAGMRHVKAVIALFLIFILFFRFMLQYKYNCYFRVRFVFKESYLIALREILQNICLVCNELWKGELTQVETIRILYQKTQNVWSKNSIYALNLLPNQMHKCHTLQVKVVVENWSLKKAAKESKAEN